MACTDETCMVSAPGADDGECRYMAWDARCAPGEVCVPHEGCVAE